jgi:hypothetical protein
VSAELSLSALHPELVSEWDRARNWGIAPAAVGPGSKLKVWWRCGACGHAWAASVGNRARGPGCPKCAVRRRAHTRSHVERSRSLAVQHPDLVGELHPTRNPGPGADQSQTSGS